MKESFNHERLPKETMLPELEKLLDAAGLNEQDTKLLQDFHQSGFSVFVHGSLLKSRLREISDIDFVLVGDFSCIPSSMRSELIPNVTDPQLDLIDCFSVGRISGAGRRMSLHVEKEEFRKLYPNSSNPYLREYRPKQNLKSSGVSKYLLCGLSQSGTLRVLRAECPQELLAHGVINTIPQTGIFLLRQKTMSTEKNQNLVIPVTHIVSSLGTRTEPTEIKDEEKTLIFGVEFDKMYTEQMLYPGDSNEIVAKSMAKTVDLANEFLGKDAQKYINESFALLEKYWPARKMP